MSDMSVGVIPSDKFDTFLCGFVRPFLLHEEGIDGA